MTAARTCPGTSQQRQGCAQPGPQAASPLRPLPQGIVRRRCMSGSAMTTAAATIPRPAGIERRVLGHAVTRIEDLPLVTGRGRYAGDINFPHQLHMRIVRSPKAHGRILSVDTSARAGDAGRGRGLDQCRHRRSVADRFPRRQERDRHPRIPPAGAGQDLCALYRRSGRGGVRRGPLCRRGRGRAGRGRDRGPAGRRLGERSARRVRARPLAAKRSCCTTASATSKPRSATPMPWSRSTSQTGRHSGVPMETRGAIGVYDAAKDLLELHGAAKIPHRNRETLCRMLNRSPSSLHVHESHVGGGFGIRGELYPEDLLVLVAAMRLQPAGEMDRGPARAPDVRQPGPRAAPPRAHRGRQGRPYPRHRGRDLPRPGRLYPHPRRERAEPHHVHADRLLQGAGLSGDGAGAAHQQDAGCDLSRARPLREHVRARRA